MEKTKPKIEENEALAAMQEKLEAMERRLTAAEDEKNVYKQTVEDLRKEVATGIERGEIAETKAEVLYDPFDKSKNPFRIEGRIPSDAEFPEGQVLHWANYAWRQERRTWRGLIPLQYGDEYTGENGERLSEYINDPPPRMKDPSRIDNYVRRGDCILCRIDARIFDSRQRQRELKAQRAVEHGGSAATIPVQRGVEIVGAGLTDSFRPKDGYKMGETIVVGNHSRTLPVRKKDK